jgi:DNA (cytosine-5)-methyltransferase 1
MSSRQNGASRPRLLDLFCGAGGAAMGYHRAGFDVVGVDIAPQPNYCGDAAFIQADALVCLRGLAMAHEKGWAPEFDAIHASPPCQSYSTLNAYNHKDYPDLVGKVRELLIATGLPYVIENVPQAPLRDPIMLCGSMFGLRVYRHRLFESSAPLVVPAHPVHAARCVRNGYLPTLDQFMTISGGKHSRAWQARAAEVMGVPWTRTIREVCEAIPPAYTEHVGRQLIDVLTLELAA